MKIQKLNARCGVKKCSHAFKVEIVVEAPLLTAVASMRAARCPKCSSRKVLLVFGKKK